MRAPALVLASASLLFFCACGGGIAPSGNGNGNGDGTGTPSGTTGASGASSSGGSTHSNPNMPTGGGGGESGATCTVGNYVFCRCADGSEGTKECLPDRSFGACACDSVTPPPPPPCVYPPNTNPPGCPATYSHAYQGQPCPTLNLVCSYPGAGDGDANGCASTAGLQCRVAPGGATSWVATQ